MNRRFFSKALTLGAGALGLWQGAADGESLPRPKPLTAKGAAPPDADAAALRAASVADFQPLARENLPQETYDYITTGSTNEVTLRDNVAAFQRIRLLPPLLTGVAKVDTTTLVFKRPIGLPILLAPVGGMGLFHPHGALGAARAAARAQTILGVSSSALSSVEEIAAASPARKWFQLYVPRDRGVARRLVERVEQSGYEAIIVTVDLGERKDADLRNRFALPHAALRKHLTDIGFDISRKMSYDELLAFNDQAWDLALSWKFFDWLRSITKLPILLKGVLRPEDARHAAEIGLEGIIVSNHGGRRLDGVPASIDQLPQVVEAVDGRTEVLLDSGIRRGTDVLKALALGARAVLIGRPCAWGLAAAGEAGVTRVLDLLREELESAMIASGCGTIVDINRSLLLPPKS